MIFAISMILWLHDMLETIDIPKGILMFRGGRTQACGKSHISRIFMKNAGIFWKFCTFPMKTLNFMDFPHFGVHGPSRNTKNPLGISIVSTMGAGVHPFYEELVILMEIHGFSLNPVNSWGNCGIYIKYRYSHPHG